MTRTNLSLRNSRNAKTGLISFADYIISQIGADISIVEIGAFSGDSAEIFAQKFREVYSIDPWKSNYDINDAASDPELYNMADVEDCFDTVAAKYPNIKKMKMTSIQASDEFEDQSIDVVYLDGLHTYDGVFNDITFWLPKAKEFIGGHDYISSHHPGVQMAVLEKFGNPRQTFRDSSWIVRL